MYIRSIIFFIAFWFTSIASYGQSFNYSYTDPCTGVVKTIPVSTNGITVTYYGQIHTFQPTDFYNGGFESWAQTVYSSFGNNNPCASIVGLPTGINIAQNTAINFLSIINSLSAISDLSSLGGATNLLSGIGSVSGSTSNKKKDDKKSGSAQTDGTTTTTEGSVSTPNGGSTTSGSSGNSGSTQTNGTATNTEGSVSTPSGGSTTSGSSTNQGTGNTNPTQPTQTGGQTTQPPVGSTQNQTGTNGNNNTSNTNSNSSGSSNTSNNTNNTQPTTGTNQTQNPTTTQNGNSQSGSTNSNSGNANQNGSGSSNSNGSSNQNGSGSNSNDGSSQEGKSGSGNTQGSETPKEEGGKTNLVGGAVSTLANSTSSGKAASTESRKPTILGSSDFVGFNFKDSDIDRGAKFTGGYTSLRWDGQRSHGILVDYTTALKGPNITGFYAIIKKKRIDLISTTLTLGFDRKTSVYGTLALGQMWNIDKKKKLKAVYMLTGSFGSVYGEEFVGTAAIAGVMYDWKISKRIDIKLMGLYVYAPYVSYYNDILLKSPHVVLPIIGTNIGLTKRFKLNINGGGAWALQENALNYTIMMGTRFLL